MFTKTLNKAMLCLALVLALCVANPQGVSAAGNGLRVSPVRSDIVVSPGETKSLFVTVTNVTPAAASLKAIINDFQGSPDETGNPAIILEEDKYAPKHSLKRFVEPVPAFDLKPGEQRSIEVKIKVPKDAIGGGYYGVVRFAPASAAEGTVSLAGSVGSLVLLKVPGDIKEQLNISSFDVRRNDGPSSFFTSNKDLAATVRFHNLGNIQEAPFGKILLKDRKGKVLATHELNSTNPPANVLPDSIRKFSVPLKNVGSFGIYKLEGNFGYGSTGHLLSGSTTFYVVPLSVILIFIAIVALLVFIVFGLPKLVRAYNKRVLRQAGRR